MKIAFVMRDGYQAKWGGDTLAIQGLVAGLKTLGHEAMLTIDPLEKADLVFLTNTCLDLRPLHHLIKLHDRPYGLIPFHENKILFSGPALGFFRYVKGCVEGESDEGYAFSPERLFENPELIYYYAATPSKAPMMNYDIIRGSSICVATCPTEEKIIQRDNPSVRTCSLLLSPGFAEHEFERNDDFLKFTSLKSKEYILQVGRIEPRKNQLATVLATKDLPMPLVFISTFSVAPEYEETVLKAIYKYRKAPTLFISEKIPSMTAGSLQIMQMPGGKKLSHNMLMNAFAHAGLLLHPAFYELPGLTYLEAAKLGLPAIASSWTTIRDYFTSPTGEYTLDDRIEYTLPYDLDTIKSLVQKKFGQIYSPSNHPTLMRRSRDVALDFVSKIR
jgi:glycosyltransferase involved in cell wall biosynthesis